VEAGIEFLYLSEPDRRQIEMALSNGPEGAGTD
jgi:hypothetical protein